MLWNVDHTLVDVSRVTRDVYAEAYQHVTGEPLVHLAPTAGRTESEIIFETLALNDIEPADHHLPEFIEALGKSFTARRDAVRSHGRVLPGAAEAVAAIARMGDVVQSVLTGSIEPSAVLKLTELGLDEHLDFDVAGYGSETYPKGALIELARTRAASKYSDEIGATVYIADSPRDVRAAKIAHAATLAVATGTATEAELRTAGAGKVLPTLADTQAVIRALEDLMG